MNNLKKYKTFNYFLIFGLALSSCMDPVVDKDDSYSDFEDFDASSYLNDPNEGFLNGGFEEGDVNLWGGFKNQFNENVPTKYNLDVQEAFYIFDSILVRSPAEGDHYLRLQSESGSAGLYRYFAYNPGDTLNIHFHI